MYQQSTTNDQKDQACSSDPTRKLQAHVNAKARDAYAAHGGEDELKEQYGDRIHGLPRITASARKRHKFSRRNIDDDSSDNQQNKPHHPSPALKLQANQYAKAIHADAKNG